MKNYVVNTLSFVGSRDAAVTPVTPDEDSEARESERERGRERERERERVVSCERIFCSFVTLKPKHDHQRLGKREHIVVREHIL